MCVRAETASTAFVSGLILADRAFKLCRNVVGKYVVRDIAGPCAYVVRGWPSYVPFPPPAEAAWFRSGGPSAKIEGFLFGTYFSQTTIVLKPISLAATMISTLPDADFVHSPRWRRRNTAEENFDEEPVRNYLPNSHCLKVRQHGICGPDPSGQ